MKVAKALKRRSSGKPTSATLPADLETVIPAMLVQQGENAFYLFTLRASVLWRLLQINRRLEDKREGYQRALSPSRVRSIERYIEAGGVLPGVIVAAFDGGQFDSDEATLKIALFNAVYAPQGIKVTIIER